MKKNIIKGEAAPTTIVPFEKMNAPMKLEYLKNQYGVSETVDLIEFLVSIAVAVKKSFADDGKFTVADALNFLSPVTLFPSAITGIDKVPLEMKDEITPEEKAAMLAVVVKAGILPVDAEEVVDEVLDILELIKRFVLERFVEPTLT